MKIFYLFGDCVRLTGLVMTEMTYASLNTARTWAFLYIGVSKNILIKDDKIKQGSRVAAYIGKRSYQVACHMLFKLQMKLALAIYLHAGAYHHRLPCFSKRNAVLTDRRQYTQAEVGKDRLALASKQRDITVGIQTYHG